MGSNAATYTAPNDTKDGDREEEEDDEDDGTRQLRAIVPRASDGAAEEGTAMIGCSEADGLAAWQKVSTTATSKVSDQKSAGVRRPWRRPSGSTSAFAAASSSSEELPLLNSRRPTWKFCTATS